MTLLYVLANLKKDVSWVTEVRTAALLYKPPKDIAWYAENEAKSRSLLYLQSVSAFLGPIYGTRRKSRFLQAQMIPWCAPAPVQPLFGIIPNTYAVLVCRNYLRALPNSAILSHVDNVD